MSELFEMKFKELWWDGRDLHYTTEDGGHIVLRNCTVTERRERHFDSTGLVSEEIVTFFKAANKISLVVGGKGVGESGKNNTGG